MGVNVPLPPAGDRYDRQNEQATRLTIEQAFLTLQTGGEQGDQGEPGGSDRLTLPNTTQLLTTDDITDGSLLIRDGTDIVGLDPDTLIETLLDIDGTYDAIENGGLVGDGAADDRAALNTLANTTIPAGGGTIVLPPGTYKISSDLTIPAKTTLAFRRGAKLSLDTGVVVTILGEIVAGPHTIFTGSTRGVRFATSAEAGNVARPRTNAAHPEWWGAIGDDSNDDYIACQRMLDAVSGYPFYSDTDLDLHTAASGTSTTVTVSSAGWTPNQWQGATLIVDSGTGAAPVYLRIASNTSDTITVDGYYTGSQNNWVFNAGDFTSVAGAPAAGSVIILSVAAASARWARMPIDWGARRYFASDTLRRTNVVGMREYGKGIDLTTVRVSGGESGTATGGTTTTITKATASWTVNQWRKHWLVITSGDGSGSVGATGFARIKSNTATTITATAAFSQGAPASGSTFAIIPESVMDFNGWFQGSIEHMTLTCDTTASMNRGTMFGAIYHRRDEESARGSSNGRFDNIWINGHAFHSFWMIGGGISYNSPWQEDLPQFINVRADGLWNFSYTGRYYQFAYFFGSGQYGNNLNHLGEGIHAAGTRTVIGVDRTNVYLNGITSGPSLYGIYPQNGVANYVEVGAWRAETCHRIFHAPLPTAACSIKLRSVSITDWVAIYDTALGCTPVFYSTSPGGLELDGFNLAGPVFSYYVAAQAAASGTTTTCTVAGTPWTVDQWKGFVFRIRSGTGKFQPPVLISGNTNNTLTFSTLAVAPDATTVFDVYGEPAFVQNGPGTVTIRRLSVSGFDVGRSLRPGGIMAAMEVNGGTIVLDPITGGQVNRYYPGPLHSRYQGTGTDGWLSTDYQWAKAGSPPDTFMGRVADGTLGISRLSSPVVTVPSLGTTPSVLADKTGTHGRSISQITRSGTTATATTTEAHLLTTGNSIAISGADEAEYNSASATVTVTSATQFTYTIAGTPGPAIISITGITRVGATATATSVAHGRTTGDSLTIAGADQAEYNGTFTITVTGVDTFTYTVVGTPATPATGTITAGGTIVATGITTRNYKLVAKVPGPAGTYKRALPSAAISVTNTWPAFSEFAYTRIYPPYMTANPAWMFDVLKDTGGGTYAVFTNGENRTADELYVFEDRDQATKAYSLPGTDETGRLEVGGAVVEAVETLTYGPSITPNMNAGQHKRIVVTDGVAFTIANPIAASVGQRLTLSILNSSGGAMGAITWGSEFEMAGAFTNPSNGTRRTITFLRETSTEWVEQGRALADIA